MNVQDYIVTDPMVLAGKPIIRGTRLSVEFVVQLLAQGWNDVDLQQNYPGITHEQIAACRQHATGVLGPKKYEWPGRPRKKIPSPRLEVA
jgi:uncharacterized protein (DUF433 family)